MRQGTLLGYHGYQCEADLVVRGEMRLVVDPLGHCQAGAVYFPEARPPIERQ